MKNLANQAIRKGLYKLVLDVFIGKYGLDIHLVLGEVNQLTIIHMIFNYRMHKELGQVEKDYIRQLVKLFYKSQKGTQAESDSR